MTIQVTMPKELIDEVRAISPFPWRQVTHPNGLIQVADANGLEVSIFLIIKVAIFVGGGLSV